MFPSRSNCLLYHTVSQESRLGGWPFVSFHDYHSLLVFAKLALIVTENRCFRRLSQRHVSGSTAVWSTVPHHFLKPTWTLSSRFTCCLRPGGEVWYSLLMYEMSYNCKVVEAFFSVTCGWNEISPFGPGITLVFRCCGILVQHFPVSSSDLMSWNYHLLLWCRKWCISFLDFIFRIRVLYYAVHVLMSPLFLLC